MSFESTAPPRPFPLAIEGLRVLLILALLLGTACFFIISIHWPMVEDSPIMHYVIFLMKHGFQPYQTITDNNMPGAYLTESWAMHLFGGGDLGWRIYDFTLLIALTLSMAVITRGRDWLAGFYGGSFFLLLHASDGPNYAGERDQAIAVLLMIAMALLFAAVRRLQPVLLLPTGFLIGLATSIKPTAVPMGIALLAMAFYVLWKRGVAMRSYLGWSCAGLFIAAAINFAFLAEHHAIGAFWFVTHTITTRYVGLAHPSFPDMLRNLMPRNFRNFVGLAGIPIFLLNRGFRGWDWERWAIALTAALAFAAYFIQHKGFVQHRYPFEAFLLLLLGIEMMQGLKTSGWPRCAAIAGILISIAYFVPVSIRTARNFSGDDRIARSIEQDITQLGGTQQLQQQVFCFDLIYGCINALYHLQLVENTGYTGDLLLFLPSEGGDATGYYRTQFWKTQAEHPANVFVITNEWFMKANTFDKINTWPRFATYLQANYTQVRQRAFLEGPPPPAGASVQEPKSYRIYVRNKSPLLDTAKRVFATP